MRSTDPPSIIHAHDASIYDFVRFRVTGRRAMTHVSICRRRAQQMNEELPLHRICPLLDGLQKERQEWIGSIRLVAIEIAKDRERYNPLRIKQSGRTGGALLSYVNFPQQEYRQQMPRPHRLTLSILQFQSGKGAARRAGFEASFGRCH